MLMIVNLAGLGLIAVIVWWFRLYKSKQVAVADKALVITLENGSYSPALIKLAADTPSTLTFLRKDASPCAEVVMIPELDINQTLPVNELVKIQLPALQAGEYAFHCQMQMYRGVLNVVQARNMQQAEKI